MARDKTGNYKLYGNLKTYTENSKTKIYMGCKLGGLMVTAYKLL